MSQLPPDVARALSDGGFEELGSADRVVLFLETLPVRLVEATARSVERVLTGLVSAFERERAWRRLAERLPSGGRR